MKVLVTGYSGQLGFDAVRALERRGVECRGVVRTDFDLTDFAAARKFVENYRPDVLIHCAAYTAVDQAEDDPDVCRLVNEGATRNLAEVCRDLAAKFIYISTDYVFPGTGEQIQEVDDPKGPCNVYGQTKLLGEQAVQESLAEHFIVRVSWVFGVNGKNFVRTMLGLGAQHAEMKIVGDQVGSPTYTADLAELLCDLAGSEKYGIYQATNEGFCSWAEFAEEIFRQAGLATKVTPIPSSERPSRACRPHNSRLSKKCLDVAGFQRLPSWQDALRRYLLELAQEKKV